QVPPDVLAEAVAEAQEATGEGDGTSTTTTTTTTAPDGGATDEGAAPLVEGENAAAVQQEPTTTTTAAPADEGDAGTGDEPAEDQPAGDQPAEDQPAGEEPAEGELQLTPRAQDEADATVTVAGADGETVYVLGPTLATGRIVRTASAEFPQNEWVVALEMRGGEDGIDRFNEIAAQCYLASDPEVCPTGQLAIVLDSVVQSAPTINSPSFAADQISISGGPFTESEAKDLALVLRYGALPVELERQTVETVSASLGEDTLRAGVIAGFAGLAIVALYMILYYRALGIVVVVGFGVWAALMYTVVSWLGETQGLALTLAGVTGMIMSIGVTVDSYVVFFERLKDEVRAGRTLRSSTDRAFRRAFRTILAANITSFIGAGVLWWLTVGSVRGFALFLGLSTVLGLVVTWFYTRPVVTWLSSSRLFTEMPFLGVARGLAARRPEPEIGAAVSGGSGR
ncbi:MAG TPA: protein translocase subunit SecD, partial [Acidimicrobiales bacterium]